MTIVPLSVVILTYNRRDELRSQMDRLLRQSLAGQAEKIVVDNNSSDGTDTLVKSYGDRFVHIRLPKNAGAVARSAGMKAARGEIVVTLDDDVYLYRDDELERIAAFFRANPQADAVNFKVVEPATGALMPIHWYHPRPFETWGDQTFETDYISEGAVAFRRSALAKVGCYPEDFFISHEGIDLALRMINAGMRVYYTGAISVAHRYSMEQRASWRSAYYNTRNYLWIVGKHEPFPAFVGKFLYRLLTTFVFCARAGRLLWWFRGVWDGLLGMPRQWKSRQPLTAEARRRLKEIRALKPGIFYKIGNFLLRTRQLNERQKTA